MDRPELTVRRSLRARRSATNTISTSFASSDGWITNGPIPNQRVELLAVMPRPGTNSASRSTIDTTSIGLASGRSRR